MRVTMLCNSDADSVPAFRSREAATRDLPDDHLRNGTQGQLVADDFAQFLGQSTGVRIVTPTWVLFQPLYRSDDDGGYYVRERHTRAISVCDYCRTTIPLSARICKNESDNVFCDRECRTAYKYDPPRVVMQRR